jgi:hypothetical protein
MELFILIIALIIAAHWSRKRGENLLALGFLGLALLFVFPGWPAALWEAAQGIGIHLPASLIGNLVFLGIVIIGLRYLFSLNRR